MGEPVEVRSAVESRNDIETLSSDDDRTLRDVPEKVEVPIEQRADQGEDGIAVVQVTTHFSEKEVTIRQVAPLVLCLTGATFMTTIAAQAVVILIPIMANALDIPETRQEWIVSSYALTSGAFLLLCGKLGDVYGKRVLFIAGSLFIAVMAIATAFSPNEIALYVFRALHGLAGAITIPTAIGILGSTIPPGRVKNYSFAFYSGGAPTGQVLGNLLGGIVSNFTSWKVVFYIIAGASLVLATAGFFVIPKEAPHVRDNTGVTRFAGIDWIGAFLFTVGLLLLLVALSEGVSSGWSTPYVIAILIISVVMLVAFVFWEDHRETKTENDPLMRVSTFRNSKFSYAMVTITLFSSGFTNFLIYTVYFYQDFLGLDPLQTTLRYIPLGIVGILTTFCSGYLLARVPGNYIITFGLVSSLIANILFAVPIPTSTNYFAYGFIAMCLSAFGADTIFPCLGLYTTQALPRKDQSVAGAMFQTMGAIGRSMSLPITAAIQTAVQKQKQTVGETGTVGNLAFLAGLRAAEWFCVGCFVAAIAAVTVGLRTMGRIGGQKNLGIEKKGVPAVTPAAEGGEQQRA